MDVITIEAMRPEDWVQALYEYYDTRMFLIKYFEGEGELATVRTLEASLWPIIQKHIDSLTHAEVQLIAERSKKLKTRDLSTELLLQLLAYQWGLKHKTQVYPKQERERLVPILETTMRILRKRSEEYDEK